MTIVRCAVEGDLDEAIARRLLEHLALEVGQVYGRRGKAHLRQNLAGYANAAQRAPWFVLVDLDEEAPCGGALVSSWLTSRPRSLALRVAVREVESWLLGDRVGLARFLNISRAVVPRDPDALQDPKQSLVNLARRSRNRVIREGLPPRPGSGRSIGPLYVTELSRFVRARWDVDVAARESESLSRCLAALAALR